MPVLDSSRACLLSTSSPGFASGGSPSAWSRRTALGCEKEYSDEDRHQCLLESSFTPQPHDLTIAQ